MATSLKDEAEGEDEANKDQAQRGQWVGGKKAAEQQEGHAERGRTVRKQQFDAAEARMVQMKRVDGWRQAVEQQSPDLKSEGRQQQNGMPLARNEHWQTSNPVRPLGRKLTEQIET